MLHRLNGITTLVILLNLLPAALFAAETGITGLGQSLSNMQPSLAMSFILRTAGDYDQLGEIVPFAGNFAPAGWAFTNGQVLSVEDNDALFSKIGSTYGGDGFSTFALPDLRGRTPIDAGQGVGLTNRLPGSAAGVEATTLNVTQIPVHRHLLPGLAITGYSGGVAQSINNLQPSLAVTFGIATTGAFPSPETASSPTWVGQVRMFASPFLPGGYTATAGQVLPISGNSDLFAVIGNQYGGSSPSTFAVPDLRGRAVNHVGAASGGSLHALGSAVGHESFILTDSQLPVHSHTVPAPANMTLPYGSGQPFNNMQPSFTLNYIINTSGNFPEEGLGATEPFLGEIALIADDQAPLNWSFCDGQVLSIADFPALYSILGTTYGGDGVSTFALPDLRGRALVGTGAAPGVTSRARGETVGVENSLVTIAELPPHTHTFTQFNADFDSDNEVDGQDFLIWQRGVGTTNPTHQQGNANGSGTVDGFDLAVWQLQYGNVPPAPLAVIPEPDALLMSAVWWVASLSVSRFSRNG